MTERTPSDITIVPDAGRFVVSYLGDRRRRVIDFAPSTTPDTYTAQIGLCLTAMSVLRSSDPLTASELLSDIDPGKRSTYGQKLLVISRLAPDIIQAVPGKGDQRFLARFGQVSFRAATAGERAEFEYIHEGKLPDEEAFAAICEQQQNDETYKIQLAEYDHARIEIEGRRFVLPLIHPTAFLACRALECLLIHAANEPYTLDRLCLDTFRALSLNERALMTDSEESLYLPSTSFYRPEIRQILSHLGVGLQLVSRSNENRVWRHGKATILYSRQNYQELPQADDRIIMAPGTSRSLSEQGLDEESLSGIISLLGILERPGRAVSHTDAIFYLDLIMDRTSKLAFWKAAEQRQFEPGEALKQAHEVIRNSLDASYYRAVQARTIAGNGFTNRSQHAARQTGGGVSAASTTDPSLHYQRWTFTSPQD